MLDCSDRARMKRHPHADPRRSARIPPGDLGIEKQTPVKSESLLRNRLGRMINAVLADREELKPLGLRDHTLFEEPFDLVLDRCDVLCGRPAFDDLNGVLLHSRDDVCREHLLGREEQDQLSSGDVHPPSGDHPINARLEVASILNVERFEGSDLSLVCFPMEIENARALHTKSRFTRGLLQTDRGIVILPEKS